MMSEKTNCCKCGKYEKVTWANYAPYCSNCIAIKNKNAISFKEVMKRVESEEDYKLLEELKNSLNKEYKKGKIYLNH